MIHSIRLATEADAAALLALRKKIFAESDTMLWEPAEFTATEDDERKRIRHLNSKANSTYLLAESGGHVVGLLFVMGEEANRLKHSAWVAMGVSKEHKGQGIGTALLQEAIAWSKRAGLVRLALTVRTTHLRAVALYLRCGFVVEGVRRNSVRVDGVLMDEYLMAIVHAGVKF